MHLDNVPFDIVETKRLECQFGPLYYKERKQNTHQVKLQGTRKMGCHAHIAIKQCTVYPQYKAKPSTGTSLRTARENEMKRLKSALSKNKDQIETVTMYYVSLPMEEVHSGHPTGGGIAGYSQRMNEKVARKIADIVADGITEIEQVSE